MTSTLNLGLLVRGLRHKRTYGAESLFVYLNETFGIYVFSNLHTKRIVTVIGTFDVGAKFCDHKMTRHLGRSTLPIKCSEDFRGFRQRPDRTGVVSILDQNLTLTRSQLS